MKSCDKVSTNNSSSSKCQQQEEKECDKKQTVQEESTFVKTEELRKRDPSPVSMCPMRRYSLTNENIKEIIEKEY
jgi:hypothetical protein